MSLVREGRCEHCGRAKAVWTPEAILTAIRAWAETHDGKGPATKDWRRAAPDHPSAMTVWEIFGGLCKARVAAGVESPGRKNAANDGWTKETIVAAIYRWHVDHGVLPRAYQWGTPPEGFPSQSTVRRHFGSWNSGIVAAGYEPTHSRRSAYGYQRQAGAATRLRVAA